MRSELRSLLGLCALAAACGGGTSDFVARPSFADGGLLRDATPVPETALAALAGVHAVDAGVSELGGHVVVRTARATVSVFAEPDATYAVLHAGCRAEDLVLEGYYRRATGTETGLVRLHVEPASNARALCRGEPPVEPVRLSGFTGPRNGPLDRPLSMHRERATRDPLGRFFAVAHRGGCRTLDACGASENSVEVIRMAESLGADAIEIDVRLTRDGVPILYHDDAFGPRLTTGPYCHGTVGELPMIHVRALCTLLGGEHVPTLEEALRAVVDDTTLRGVWLDVKSTAALAPARALAARHTSRASALGRDVQIIVGLPSEELHDAWARMPGSDGVACLSELEPGDVDRAGCTVWAPRWTRGLLTEDARALQAKGGLVAYWTLDEPDFIDVFLAARPNAILTNRPGLVRHRFEMVGAPP